MALTPPRRSDLFGESYKLRTQKQALEQSITGLQTAVVEEQHKLQQIEVMIEELEKEAALQSSASQSSKSFVNIQAPPTSRFSSDSSTSRSIAPYRIIKVTGGTKSPVASRPGLVPHEGFKKTPILKNACVPSLVAGTSRTPRGKYIICPELGCIVQFDDGCWHEVWCPLCGANGPTSRDGFFVGTAGLKRHIARVHDNACGSLFDGDTLNASSHHRLTKEEIISIRLRKMTIRKVCDEHPKPRAPSQRKKATNAVNDLDDDELNQHIQASRNIQRAASISSNDVSDDELAQQTLNMFKKQSSESSRHLGNGHCDDHADDDRTDSDYLDPSAWSSRKRRREELTEDVVQPGQEYGGLIDRLRERRVRSSPAHYSDLGDDDGDDDVTSGAEKGVICTGKVSA